MNGVCECDTNTIWDRNHLNCIVCPAGTYKDIHDCKKCPDGCSLCFSSTVCFECGDGYDLRE